MKWPSRVFASISPIVLGVISTSLVAQGTFQNFDFESATPSTPINGPDGQVYQPTSLALPGWNAYIGTTQQSEIQNNVYGHGEAEIDLFGPNYPAAQQSGVLGNPGVIDGNYSVLLQAGAEPGNTTVTVSTSMAQTGAVPVGAQSLQFKAWQTVPTEFTVSFDGNSLSPVALGAGANYTLYAVNIAPYAGQSGPLEFTSDFVSPGEGWLGLDDIAFSAQAVPEPSTLKLILMGGMIFGVNGWRKRGKFTPA